MKNFLYTNLTIFLVLAPYAYCIYAMEYYEITTSNADYTIFTAKSRKENPQKIFSFLSIISTDSHKTNEYEVFVDAYYNEIIKLNSSAFEEYTHFVQVLENSDDPDEYEKNCHAMLLVQQSRLLKMRLQKKGRNLKHQEKQLLLLPNANVYILEYLLKIEQEKLQKNKPFIEQLTHQSFWWS